MEGPWTSQARALGHRVATPRHHFALQHSTLRLLRNFNFVLICQNNLKYATLRVDISISMLSEYLKNISRKKRSACHTGRCFEHAGVAARSLSEKQKHFARQVGSKLLNQLDFINSSLNSLSAWFLCSEILVHDFWLLDCLPGLEWGLQMDQAAGSWDLEVLVLVEEEEVEVSVCHACWVLKLGSTAPQWSNPLNSVSYFWLPMLHPPCPLACTTWGWLGLLDFKKTKCRMWDEWIRIELFKFFKSCDAWCLMLLDATWCYLMLLDATWCYFTWC